MRTPVDPMSPEFQARAWKHFDDKIAAEKKRKEQFGDVMPIIHTEAWDKRLVGVGDRIYFTDPKATFSDFLQNYLRDSFGTDWWKEQATKPALGRHRVAQWQTHAEELMRGEKPDAKGRYLIPRDGQVTALLALAYDLYVVRQNVPFQENVIDRLRQANDFVGTRYELLVAATFARAGFKIEPEDESDGSAKHPEFIATHRPTNFAVAVEAKARNRRLSDRNPDRVGVEDLIANAAEKATADVPFVLFVDVAMPPEDRSKPPSWLNEVDHTVNNVVMKYGGVRGPFDWVFFTNIPHQYGLSGEPDPPRHYMEWVPRTTRIPEAIRAGIAAAVQQYGNIPEFETSS
jgi:hypothetical protein